MIRIALLGCGLMGAPMSRRLLAAGYPLTVWNRTRAKAEALAEAGATVADTPAAAVAQADLVITMLEHGGVVKRGAVQPGLARRGAGAAPWLAGGGHELDPARAGAGSRPPSGGAGCAGAGRPRVGRHAGRRGGHAGHHGRRRGGRFRARPRGAVGAGSSGACGAGGLGPVDQAGQPDDRGDHDRRGR